jgi:hypothetical protein
MNRLDKHQKIGIDFDHTLVNSNKTHLFEEYILANPDKEYWIVTFRNNTGFWTREQTIFDLQSHTKLTMDHFEDIVMQVRQPDIATQSIILDGDESMHWKGLMCYERDITIMIDDMPEWVLPGCERYGIDFIDTFTL